MMDKFLEHIAPYAMYILTAVFSAGIAIGVAGADRVRLDKVETKVDVLVPAVARIEQKVDSIKDVIAPQKE